jgi:hypothetical protein
MRLRGYSEGRAGKRYHNDYERPQNRSQVDKLITPLAKTWCNPASKVRFQGAAEVTREAKPADSVENDPKRITLRAGDNDHTVVGING